MHFRVDHPGIHSGVAWKSGSHTSIPVSVPASLLPSFIPSPSSYKPWCVPGPGISFIPREVGEHLVSIKKNGNHVANSPVSIMVVQSEIGDARRAKVYGRGLSEGRTFEMSEFIVDTRDAGLWLVPGERPGAVCSSVFMLSSYQPPFLSEHPPDCLSFSLHLARKPHDPGEVGVVLSSK